MVPQKEMDTGNILGMRMGFVVDIHKLANGSVRIFLRRGKRLVAEQFLNRAQIRAVGKKMRRKGVAKRVRMQVPIDIHEANVFLDDAPD